MYIYIVQTIYLFQDFHGKRSSRSKSTPSGSKGRRLQDLDASGETNISLVELQAFLPRFFWEFLDEVMVKLLRASKPIFWRKRAHLFCEAWGNGREILDLGVSMAMGVPMDGFFKGQCH